MSDREIRQIFDDSVAYIYGSYDNDIHKDLVFEKFSKRFFPFNTDYSELNQLLYASGLNYLDTSIKTSNVGILTIAVMPCFQHPYTIQLRRQSNGTALRIGFTDGDGCYATGKIKLEYHRLLGDTLYLNCIKNLELRNFWNLKEEKATIVDGASYLLECWDKGKFKKLYFRPGYGNGMETKALISYIRELEVELGIPYYRDFLNKMH